MGERCGRGRVGKVIGRHVNGLNRGDGAVFCGGDALLQLAHFVCEGRLITDSGRHTAEKRGNLTACLHETEDVIDEEQDVLVLFVTEMLCHGEAGEGDTHTHARGLVHLAENERRFIADAAFTHFTPEVVTLTAALADAGKHGVTAVLHGDVVDELLDKDGLADACAAEQTDFAALRVRLQKIDDLDAGLEDLDGRVLLVKRRSFSVNAFVRLGCGNGFAAVDGIAEHVEHAAERVFAHRHFDGFARSLNLHTAGKTLTAGKHDAADRVVTHMLGNLHHIPPSVHGKRKGFSDFRQNTGLELYIDDRAGDLYDLTCIHVVHASFLCF